MKHPDFAEGKSNLELLKHLKEVSI